MGVEKEYELFKE